VQAPDRGLVGGAWRRRLEALTALPAPVQDALRLAYVGARVTSDRRSLRTFARVARTPDGAAVSTPARLRLRSLGGAEVVVRPGTSDLGTVRGTFARHYHLPPPELGAPGTIWDLGANIGLTMAHFARLYPRARVLGVELDEDNVALARRNVAAWADRCRVIHAAVWASDGEVHYRGWPGGTSNYQVTGPAEEPGREGGKPVRAVSLAELMREHGGPVDYVKVDIEGAERELLRDGAGWAESVRCIKVELHGDYAPQECVADLRRLGFEAWQDPRHWACVVGLRRA
jgi:FkbM family methyltransferase